MLNRDRKEQNEKHPHEDRQRFSGTNRDGMRKPQTNASNAFQKPNRHHSRDTDASETPSQQAEREVRRQRSEAEDAPVPPHGRSSTSQAGAAPEQRSAVDPFPSAAAANLSAAAQLKARLRGVPAAELATTSRTVCHIPLPPPPLSSISSQTTHKFVFVVLFFSTLQHTCIGWLRVRHTADVSPVKVVFSVANTIIRHSRTCRTTEKGSQVILVLVVRCNHHSEAARLQQRMRSISVLQP